MAITNSRVDARHLSDRSTRLPRMGIWEWDLVTDTVYNSPEWKRLRGCDGDMLQTPEQATQWVHPDDRLKRKKLHAKLIAGELEQIEFELRIKRDDGSWGRVIERAYSICNNEGQPIRLVGSEVDVSSSDEQEPTFQQGNKLPAPQFDSLPVAVVQFENQFCVSVNEYWSQLTGRSKESALGDGWIEAIHPGDRNRLAEFNELHRKGIPGDVVVIDGVPGRHLNPDGSTNWFLAKVRLTYGMDGTIASSSVIVLDITERKKCERQQERLIDILEATTDFIGISTPDNKVLWQNKRLAALRPDLKPEEQADFSIAYPDSSRKIMQEVAIPAATQHGSWSGNLAILDLDGNEIPVSQVLTAHKGTDGLVEAISTIMRDISAREKTEGALRLSERNYASLAATAPVGIFRMSDPSNCIYVNENWSKLTGHPPEAALGRGWMEFVHPDDLEILLEKSAAFAADPKQIVHDVAEARQLRPDGSTYWVQCHLAKELDDNGNVTGYVGTLNDIDRVKRAEEELQELNQRLHNVLEFSSIGVWNWFCEEKRLVWDEKMHEIYGVNAADFRGIHDDWLDRIHPADLERILAEDACRAESNKQLPQEFRIVRPNGDVRHIYSNVYTELNEHGEPVRATGVNVDITDHRQAELALLESENKLQHIADHLPGMVYRYFLDSEGNHGFQYLSSQVRDLFGFEPAELIANSELLWQWIEPSDAERITKKMHESASDLSRHQEEFRVSMPGRGTRWFQANSLPKKVGNGHVVWDGVILEITDRKEVELALEDAKLQMERITENVPGVIYQYVQRSDGTHAMTFMSSQCRDMYGLNPEEIMGDVELLFDLCHSEDVEIVREALARSAKTLQPMEIENRVLIPGKGLRWHQSIGQPFRNGDDTIWNGMVLDITDRKEVELANDVLAKATKTKDEFLANMSHELRTPLTAILAMTDGLQQGMFGETTPKQMESLKIVEQSGEHLLALINEVLDLAKIESGQTELEFSYINVSQLCESCLNFVTQQAEQKQIELSLKVPWNLPELGADEKRIQQVLINLLSNAVKFTPEGGQVKLKIETLAATTTDNASETIRFSVSDNGIGIKDDQLDSLFEPFVQGDSSLTRQHGGTGLGLSLVKKYVELHQGEVRVTSEPSKGSCFIVDLPFRKLRSEQVLTKQVRSELTSSDNREQLRASEISAVASNVNSPVPREGDYQPLILLAEDNDDIALTMIPILEFSKFRVLRAVNGKIAVEMAREHSPDLILMDIQMPEMDGLEATRQIREIANLSQLPIIAVSGFAKTEDSQRCIEAGVNLFMAKPLRIKELVKNINSLLTEQETSHASGSPSP